MSRWVGTILVCLFLALPLQAPGLAALAAQPVTAGATYQVNSTADTPDADVGAPACADAAGHCTLRAAIMQANFTTGVNTITVPSGTYLLTRPGDDDGAVLGDLDVTDDLVIQGAGSGSTIVDGNGTVTHDRVFQILSSSKDVSLSGLTIRAGQKISNIFDEGGGLLWQAATIAQLHLSDVAVTNNQASYGGGLFLEYSGANLLDSVDLENVTVSANVATFGAGGGIDAVFGGSESDFLLNNSQVYSNTAFQGGGLEFDGNASSFSSLRIDQTDIYSNTAVGHGGGINSATGSASSPLLIFNSHLHNNDAPLGGGVEIGSRVVISQTTLDQNTAGLQGGALFIEDGARPDIVQSTLNANRAVTGGGIYITRFALSSAVVTMTNSTLSGNTASRDGGGLYANLGTISLFNDTVAFNQVAVPNGDPYAGIGGGVYISPTATLNSQSSIYAGNTHGYGASAPVPDDCVALMHSLGYNLIQDETNCILTHSPGNIAYQDPLLGPLQFNGGPTLTHALLSGSPAIDAAETSTPGCTDSLGAPLTIDQRGFARPHGAHCDIGAFEYYPPGPFLPLIWR